MNSSVETLAERLIAVTAGYHRCVVAFSAGVDSTVVAKAVYLSLGDAALAVTAVSPSLSGGELDEAKAMAKHIGIRHDVMTTHEVSDSKYRQNNHDRCYFCKTELYDRLAQLVEAYPDCVIANGTNTDDLGDYRPGLQAAAEHGVRSPLVECGINKKSVRALAAFWELPVWNKPAMPCLSSRIAYGVEVTPARLNMIDRAEQFLRERGFRELRVRYHDGELARIEVASEEIARLIAEPLRSSVIHELEAIGFKFVTIDLRGFRSGNLNTLIPVEALTK